MRERDGLHSLCCCFSCILCVYHPWAFQILGDVRDSHWSFLARVWNPRIWFYPYLFSTLTIYLTNSQMIAILWGLSVFKQITFSPEAFSQTCSCVVREAAGAKCVLAKRKRSKNKSEK